MWKLEPYVDTIGLAFAAYLGSILLGHIVLFLLLVSHHHTAYNRLASVVAKLSAPLRH